jgi:hypothetical protein
LIHRLIHFFLTSCYEKYLKIVVNIQKSLSSQSQILGTAGVVKLVDMLDLGSSAARRVGSSPSTRTNEDKEGANVRFASLYFR